MVICFSISLWKIKTLLVFAWVFCFSLEFFQVYPKVKVRTEGRDDQHGDEHNWSSLLSLKDIQFLSIQDSCFPVKGHQEVSPSPVARIPKSYVPNVVMPAVSVSEGEDKKSSSDEENTPSIRVSSVPRPRAVLSSPDNDAMIGNKNRVKAERSSALKNRRLIQSRHAQCKIIASPVIDGSPTNTKSSKDANATDNKSEVKGRKRIGYKISSQRQNIATDRSSLMRI